LINLIFCDKGKLSVNWGRKATGLALSVGDSRVTEQKFVADH